jgi:hypothetical protein
MSFSEPKLCPENGRNVKPMIPLLVRISFRFSQRVTVPRAPAKSDLGGAPTRLGEHEGFGLPLGVGDRARSRRRSIASPVEGLPRSDGSAVLEGDQVQECQYRFVYLPVVDVGNASTLDIIPPVPLRDAARWK